MEPDTIKQTLIDRLEKLSKAFKHGTFKDDTFSLLEIEIKQIQSAILEITTQPDEKSVEPDYDAIVLDSLKQLNNRLKLVK